MKVLGLMCCGLILSAQVTAKDVVDAASSAAQNKQAVESGQSQAEKSPEALIKGMSDSLIERLKSGSGKKSIKALYDIIDQEFLPHIDKKAISRRVLSKHWKSATGAQQDQFVAAFTQSLTLFYARAFSQYTDQTISYLPSKKSKKSKAVLVRSQIEFKDRGPLGVDYRMNARKSGQWRVQDIIVEGVSLVKSKRKEIGRLVAKDGIDKVTAQLLAKSQEALAEK